MLFKAIIQFNNTNAAKLEVLQYALLESRLNKMYMLVGI